MKRKKQFPISAQLFVGVFTLSLVIVIVIGIMAMSYFREGIEQSEIKYHLEITNNTKEQFSLQMTMIDECIYELIKQPVLQEVMHKKDKSAVSEEAIDELEKYIEVMESINYSINNVHILAKNGIWISTSENFSDKKWQDYFQKYLKVYLEEPGRKGVWTDFHSSEEDNYLSSTSYIKPVFDSETKEVFGIAVLDISYESFHKLFTSSSIFVGDRAVIVNQNGKILFQYPLQADYTEVLKKYPQVVERGTQIEGKLYKKDVIIVSEKIPVADWSIVRFVNKEAATKMFHGIVSAMSVVLLIVVGISLCYAMMLMHIFTRPIRKLMQVCHKVMQGDFDAHVEIPRRDEFGELGETFNHMLRQINLLFAQEKVNQERKAEMEFQIMEAQINPHFLYNTLDSIKWLAVMQGIDNIGEMCTALINLLKYNLRKKEGNTILQDELDSVSNYIVIQKYRYSDIFEFTTDIDEKAANCRILRFILQPLVENSIVHGFGGERENYRIHITARIYGEQLHIKVIDNGEGMDRESTELLNQGAKKATRFNHIGVKNIRERLRLYFGEEARLVFESEPNVATIAEIILPVILETKK